jgi:flavin-dependent dehydrogenase
MFDVVVVGGGPAGLSVAGALQLRGHSVALFERTTYGGPRPGETLGGETFSLLAALGAWKSVEELVARQVPFRAIHAAWGSSDLEERATLLNAYGEGRHVDRARFDEALVGWAESVGVSVRRDAGTCTAKAVPGGFRVDPTRGEAAEGRYFVDASGRGAPAGAGLRDRRWLALDRQVALVGRMRTTDEVGYDLLLESAEHGWWYSVPQPDGGLVVVLVTDADLVLRGDRAELPLRYRAALAATRHTSARCAGMELEPEIRVTRADSGRLLPDHGHGWCAVGDAAMAGDPLAGNGVPRALRGALEAVQRVDAELHGRAADESPNDRRFSEFLERRAEYYAVESRWADAPFWLRRRAVPWKESPITLDPTALLRPGTAPSRAALAPVELLLPPRAIASTLATVREATPAHVALSALRAVAPLGDHRLLVGLQMLVATGALTVAPLSPAAT